MIALRTISSKKNTGNENSSVKRTKQNRLMLASNCTIRGKKKSRFIKNQETSKLELHEAVFQYPALSQIKENCSVLIIFEMISLK